MDGLDLGICLTIASRRTSTIASRSTYHQESRVGVDSRLSKRTSARGRVLGVVRPAREQDLAASLPRLMRNERPVRPSTLMRRVRLLAQADLRLRDREDDRFVAVPSV